METENQESLIQLDIPFSFEEITKDQPQLKNPFSECFEQGFESH